MGKVCAGQIKVYEQDKGVRKKAVSGLPGYELPGWAQTPPGWASCLVWAWVGSSGGDELLGKSNASTPPSASFWLAWGDVSVRWHAKPKPCTQACTWWVVSATFARTTRASPIIAGLSLNC
jgi:hypothetical protein